MNKYEQIEKMGNLLEKWYITKEEFEVEKKKILWNSEIESNYTNIQDRQNFRYEEKINDKIEYEEWFYPNLFLYMMAWYLSNDKIEYEEWFYTEEELNELDIEVLRDIASKDFWIENTFYMDKYDLIYSILREQENMEQEELEIWEWLTKSKLLEVCNFQPRPWYEHLWLGIITLWIYWYIFAYKRWKFLSLIKKRSTNYNWFLIIFIMLIFIFLSIPTSGWAWLIFLFVLSIRYIIYFRDIKIVLLIFYFYLIFFMFSLPQFEVSNVSFTIIIFIFCILYVFIITLIYIYRIDYLIKDKLTEDLRVVEDEK